MGIKNHGYRKGEHPEDDDNGDMKDGIYNINTGQFSDIWDTEDDPARRWGTKEYFKRVDRDGWHVGRDSIANETRRIKTQADKDIERIKANAKRIKADAERMARDAKRMARDARRAATLVTGGSHTHTVSGSFDKFGIEHKSNRSTSVSPSVNSLKSKITKKKKRRFKLSSKSGGIGMGTIIFWGMLLFWFCDDDKAEKTAEIEDIKTQDKVVERVKEAYNNIKPEAQALINKAKNEFNKTVKEEKPRSVANNNDPFTQEDDKYGSIEDKW